MAVKVRSLSSDSDSSQNDELLNLLLEKYKEDLKPKANFLERVLAPMTGVGSIIDAYHDARFEDNNAGILNVLKNYGKNVYGGFKTFATGRKEEDNIEGFSETMDKVSPAWREGLGKHASVRMISDVAAGLLTDPLTYVTFGASKVGSLADDAAKVLAKKPDAVSKGLTSFLRAGRFAESTVDDILKSVVKNLGQEAGDKFLTTMNSVAHKQGKNLSSGAMKAFGKTVTENPNLVRVAKAFDNPLGEVAGLAGKATKKFSPDTYFAVKNMIDPVGAAIERGRPEVAETIMKFRRASGSVGRKAEKELREAGIIEAYSKLAPKSRKRIGRLVEATRAYSPEDDVLKTLQTKKQKVKEILENIVQGRTIEGDFLPELGDIYSRNLRSETQMTFGQKGGIGKKVFKEVVDKTPTALPEDIVKALTSQFKAGDTVLDRIYSYADELISSGNIPKKKELNSVVDKLLRDYSDDLHAKARDRIFLLQGSANTLFPPELITDGLRTSKKEREFLEKYFNFQRGQSNKLKNQGFDTISEFLMGYIGRDSNIEGYKEEFLRDVLSRDVSKGTVEDIMKNKTVRGELNRLGHVKEETLKGLLKEENAGVLSSYKPGDLSVLLDVRGSQKKRVFEKILEAEKAGIVYKDDWLGSIVNTTTRQGEQLLAKSTVDSLITLTDDAGLPLFRKDPVGIYRERITIPGTKAGAKGKVLYTDKITAGMTNVLLDRFTKAEDIDATLSIFDKAMGVWKGWVTGSGPRFMSYHMRNAFDDTLRIAIDPEIDITKLPQSTKMAVEMVKFNEVLEGKGLKSALKEVDTKMFDGLYKKLGLKPQKGLTVIEDLWNRVIESGVYADVTQSISEAGLRRPLAGLTGIKPSFGETIGDTLTLGGKFNQREQMSRLTAFFNVFDKTGSVGKASEATRRILFNYNESTPFENKVLKRVFPFVSFIKNNLKFYLNILQEHPDRLAKYKNVLDGLQSGSQSLYREEWENAPDYVKGQFSIPYKNRKGELKVLTGLGMSIEGLNDLSSLKGFLGQNANPLLRYIIEKGSGKNLYKDVDILDDNDASRYKTLPDWAKELLGISSYDVERKDGSTYTKHIMPPETKYNLESAPGAPQLTGLLIPLLSLTSKEAHLQHLTNTLAPARIYDIKEVGEKQQKQKQINKLYDLLRKQGRAKKYTKDYIPKQLKERLLKE